MTIGSDLAQPIINLLTVITGPAVLGYFATQLIKRHRGNLTRASQQDVANKRVLLREQRLENYAHALREDIIQNGHKPRPWPPGLKPKD